MKKTLLFLLFLLSGIILGTIITNVTQNISFLKWLCWGDSIGIGYPNPVSIDLAIIKINFGFILEVNIAKILSIIGCIFIYSKVSRKMS